MGLYISLTGHVLNATETLTLGLATHYQRSISIPKIQEEYINFHLSRRQKGFGRGKRMKIENDKAEIYCGVRLGYTIGAPIGLILPNLDWKNWKDIMSSSKNDDFMG